MDYAVELGSRICYLCNWDTKQIFPSRAQLKFVFMTETERKTAGGRLEDIGFSILNHILRIRFDDEF
jgi:hypothetical protein